MWGVLITDKLYKHAAHWKAFLGEYQKDAATKKSVTNDDWKMFYDFLGLTANNDETLNAVISDGRIFFF